ncbi:uncharacterized protein LOC134456735 [Engraulis encrasicolus]|uniref:uncharacterized protein LOC134456735 n=1 Tax=Engraulis encrasicolus TaxID=184585 RepID=UPI002FD611F5
MVVEVELAPSEQLTENELLHWINQLLTSGFTKVDQICSGAPFCQLINLLFPGSVNLERVKFQAQQELDILHNYSLLQVAFRKNGIAKTIPVETLIQGQSKDAFHLLLWFKDFFNQKLDGQTCSNLPLPTQNPSDNQMDLDVQCQDDAPNKSEDSSPLSHSTETSMDTSDSTDCPNYSAATLKFIQRHRPEPFTASSPPLSLGDAKDITAICSDTAYCLYVYGDVELGEEERGNVILIGFFDQTAGQYCVRLLDVIQPVENMEATELTSLLETLKRFDVPLTNCAAFYCNLDLERSRALTLGLRAINTSIVSFGGLAVLTGQACHDGLAATGLHDQIIELIRKLSSHVFSSGNNGTLRQFFCDLAKLNTDHAVTTQSLLFIRSVCKISKRWSALTEYFHSREEGDEEMASIHSLLMDRRLQLVFMFLSFALEPLATYQETLEEGPKVGKVLQDATGLLKLYTSSFLSPSGSARFLRKWDETLLHDKEELLPMHKAKLGRQVDEFLSNHKAEVADLMEEFYKTTVAFYVAVTSSITKTLPLSSAAFTNISGILKPEGRVVVTSKAVVDIASQIGFCQDPDEVTQLTDDFLEYQLSDNVDIEADVDCHWKKALTRMGKSSLFSKLVLKFLAFPRVLTKDKVFERVFQGTGESQKDVAVVRSTEEDLEVCSSTDELSPMDVDKETEDEDDDDVIATSESIVIEDSDSDEEAIIWTDVSYNKNNTSTPEVQKEGYPYQDGQGYEVGELVWGNVTGYSSWPGEVLPWRTKDTKHSVRKIRWFGDGLVSRMHIRGLNPFSAFPDFFCHKSLATLAQYKAAIMQSLQKASERSAKEFSLRTDNKDEILRHMLDWAFDGFKPSGPDGFKPNGKVIPTEKTRKRKKRVKNHPPPPVDGQQNVDTPSTLKQVSVSLNKLNLASNATKKEKKPLDGSGTKSPSVQKRGRPKKLTPGQKKEKSLKRSLDKSMDKSVDKPTEKATEKATEDQQEPEAEPEPDFTREEMVQEVLIKGKNIEDFCLSCGTSQISIFHPLFEGGLCSKCKDNFTETLYRYDEDGYQSYCTVCCYGLEVILCGNHNCCRSYCVDCLNILVGSGTFEKLKEMDPWICYLCEPSSAGGSLKPRQDWSIRVQEFFANDSGLAFEPHRVYPSIPANQRRPLRVLSLFDGIATGYLVLKDLGFKVETYVASEVDDESIAVSMVAHDGKIEYVDDVRAITKEHIQKWGPFDLLIGGSPCNDLSIVNPARKGLFEGTGRLFFDFYRILNILRPKEDDPKPFFWLFENVSFMMHRDKTDICRFLECNPVLIDAARVSPAHRARCFWGNLPGMNRPIIASQNDKLSLQECLEIGRTAKFTKVRTITTRSNSLKQGANDDLFPVTMNGKDDNLWITELEKIFGFPKHYTDVKNMGRQQRQKVLGKSWSVPVIRHLFAPLKDYFACHDMASVTTSNTVGC